MLIALNFPFLSKTVNQLFNFPKKDLHACMLLIL